MGLKKSFSNFSRQYFSGIDIPLFATIVAICVFSVWNMLGISGIQESYFIKQLVFVCAGLVLMSLFSFFNYRYWKNYSLFVFASYVIAVLLLVMPFFFRSIRGVQSWIIVGGFTFEPAELMKLVLIVLMAKYFSQRHALIQDYRHIIVSGLYCLIPAAITLVQPDLGSAIIIGIIWLGMLLTAGINKRHLFVLVVLTLVAGTAGWLFVLKPYQKVRVLSFLNPADDPRGSGYNLIQSKIAIGAGGVWGNGWGSGPQTQNGFLPEPYNDFVFAATADQFGLAGILAVEGAILFLVYRVLHIGRYASSNFGKLFCLGLAIFIATHAIIGAGVNLGLLPVTGIPFPFLSYGGSSMLSFMMGLGIAQSIKRYG
ncbi:MAG TPA: FtsW/RodA/SpoVE family cell cycle protein [Candidatus Paceibacterota bacterium]|nr:FtsW/RodA/SpoVE family cell cycle protein [Candidatus Paceibacterota bacterium]